MNALVKTPRGFYKNPFPKTWKSWRPLRAGEALKYNDRVITGTGECLCIREKAIIGGVITARGPILTAGFYFRRVKSPSPTGIKPYSRNIKK